MSNTASIRTRTRKWNRVQSSKQTHTLRIVYKIRVWYEAIQIYCFLRQLSLFNERLRLGVIRTLHTTSYPSIYILREGISSFPSQSRTWLRRYTHPKYVYICVRLSGECPFEEKSSTTYIFSAVHRQQTKIWKLFWEMQVTAKWKHGWTYKWSTCVGNRSIVETFLWSRNCAYESFAKSASTLRVLDLYSLPRSLRAPAPSDGALQPSHDARK